MSYRNSVGARLAIAFAGVILVFAVAVGLGLARLAAFNTAVSEITGAELANLETTTAWSAALSESMRHARNMLIMDDKSQIQGEAEKIAALTGKGAEYARAMTASVQSEDGKALLQAALDSRTNLLPLDQEFISHVQAGDFKAAKETLLTRSRPAQLALIGALAKLGDYQRTRIHERATLLDASYRRIQLLLLSLSVIAVAVACLLAVLLTRVIKRPLDAAAIVLGEIGKGNYTSVIPKHANDEIGRTLQGLELMQTALRERTEKEHAMAVENGRIRIALERVSVGVMVADTDGKITFANDCATAIFRKQAGEIRKSLTQFDPERIVGYSFDQFHKVPSHQRNMLATLNGTHTLDLRLGGAALRIIANPVIEGDKRLGTVVQWLDRTEEVSTEEEVQNMVAGAIEGDLTVRIVEEGKAPFFKSLAVGVNRLLENMADVIRTMGQAAAEVRTGSEEISRGNTDLSQRTEEQASSLEETASSMEQMTSTVKNNADNAAQANQLASAAREQAERGGSVVGAAVTAMSEINASSKRIADIISVIDEIAFQTNLLALNAAVEAARAGEQGRGFAVVAAEVRNLASRSAQAAKEIKALINDSVGKVTEGTKLVDESGKVLAETVVRVKKVTDVMAEIASSSREQASGIEQVNKAITMMDDVTQQNAALVEQASAAAQALTEQASNLTQLISRYKVGGNPAAKAAAVAPAHSMRSQPAPVATERRAPNRPLSGAKRTATAAAPRSALARKAEPTADEEWKDF